MYIVQQPELIIYKWSKRTVLINMQLVKAAGPAAETGARFPVPVGASAAKAVYETIANIAAINVANSFI